MHSHSSGSTSVFLTGVDPCGTGGGKPSSSHIVTMSDTDWLEPLDRRIKEVRRETEAIKKANEALKRLYDNNDEGMKLLAGS